jgi:1-acyl-sn-glycerol-3-phosphate acyltransferase
VAVPVDERSSLGLFERIRAKVHPEGERTLQGEIGRFLPGAGLIASRLQLPDVPIRLRGLEVLHRHARWPKPGEVEVIIGDPILPRRCRNQSEGSAITAECE